MVYWKGHYHYHLLNLDFYIQMKKLYLEKVTGKQKALNHSAKGSAVDSMNGGCLLAMVAVECERWDRKQKQRQSTILKNRKSEHRYPQGTLGHFHYWAQQDFQVSQMVETRKKCGYYCCCYSLPIMCQSLYSIYKCTITLNSIDKS